MGRKSKPKKDVTATLTNMETGESAPMPTTGPLTDAEAAEVNWVLSTVGAPAVRKSATRHMIVPFAPEVRECIVQDLLATLRETETLEAEKKNVMKDFADRIGGREATAHELAQQLRAGGEAQDVPVDEYWNYATGRIAVYPEGADPETTEPITTRGMIESERQSELPLDGPTPEAIAETVSLAGLCRVCGCTDAECMEGCVDPDGVPCHFVDDAHTLCSACEARAAAPAEAALV